MRKQPTLRTATLSEVDSLKEQGYVPLQCGDASKANSDYFVVMVRDDGGGNSSVKVVCPSFLRGPLGWDTLGSFSY